MPSMFKASACLQHSVEQGEVHSFIIIIAICLVFFSHLFIICVAMHLHICVCVHATICMWNSEDNLCMGVDIFLPPYGSQILNWGH